MLLGWTSTQNSFEKTIIGQRPRDAAASANCGAAQRQPDHAARGREGPAQWSDAVFRKS
jgi:hypothetical protein